MAAATKAALIGSGCFRAAQPVQAVSQESVGLVVLPVGHGAQPPADPAAPRKLPGPHGVQALAPALLLYLPAAHEAQADSPDALAKSPWAHWAHVNEAGCAV